MATIGKKRKLKIQPNKNSPPLIEYREKPYAAMEPITTEMTVEVIAMMKLLI